ncbi:MAG: hypothetical protein GXP14_11995 [Gammaproteobacteria bacterium]|nr:hypothetical protein [Gammaproteobacteria bacterium]
MKFVRRPDLTLDKRIHLAMLAMLCQGTYGAMSQLANQSAISRTFLYQLMNQAILVLSLCFSDRSSLKSETSDRHWHELILLLRLEGKCSISSITEILNYQGLSPSCHGTLSERFKTDGSQLPNTLKTDQPYYVMYLADEIFACHRPILITIEPVSTAILRIELSPNRNAATWKNHFQQIQAHHYCALGLGSDRGTGLTKGFTEACPDKPWYSDHFHELSDLYQYLTRLENQAYAMIEQESECLRKFNNARSSDHLHKRLSAYEQAVASAHQMITRYDQLQFLVKNVSASLQFFDTQGRPQTPDTAKETIRIALDLMPAWGDTALNDITQTLWLHIDDITDCLKQASVCYDQLTDLVPIDARDSLCLAWQHWHQTHQTKSATKRYHQSECDFWLGCVEPFLGESAQTVIDEAFARLNAMVRASSLVEMVNSHLRPYLNACKGQITQETLNLIMFYHNHRRYKAGKRQGQAPIEILKRQTLDKHWVELLTDTLATEQAA